VTSNITVDCGVRYQQYFTTLPALLRLLLLLLQAKDAAMAPSQKDARRNVIVNHHA